MNEYSQGPFQRTDGVEGAEAETYAHVAAQGYLRRYPFADAAAIEAVLAMGTAWNAFRLAFSQELASLGMGKALNRYSALRILYFAEDRRVLAGRLSRELNVTTANMTYMIDGMESDGLVRRVASEQDRRSTFVELTRQGEALCEEVLPGVVDFLNRTCSGFDEDEKELLMKLLERFQRHIEALPSRPPTTR